jgi:hypothetical protein
MNIIHYDSDEAAKYVTNISGWVSSKGHFYGEKEDLARYDGCTHRACAQCGALTEKLYTVCPLCRTQNEIERYAKLEPLYAFQCMEKSGVNELVLYSEALDEYFFDISFEEILEQYDYTSVEELRLVWCEPQYLPMIDPYDYFADELPEDGEVPSEIMDAFDDLNEVIKNYNKNNITGWYPSKYRVIV